MPRAGHSDVAAPICSEANPWSALRASDESLYRRYANANPLPFSYERGWGYVVQQSRLFGLKAVVGGVFSTAVIKDTESPFAFLLPPVGAERDILRHLPALAASLSAATNRRVVVRKSPVDWERKLGEADFRRIEPGEFAVASECPEDIYPQVVLDTDIAEALVHPRLQKTRNQLNVLRRDYPARIEPLRIAHRKALRDLIDKWGTSHNQAIGDDTVELGVHADAGAYHCLVDAFAHRVDDDVYFGSVLFIDGVAVGFCLAERVGEDAAALYASLALRGFRGASEFLSVSFLGRLADAGIHAVNLGGSETLGLYRYKRKFGPLHEIHTVELEYQPPRIARRGNRVRQTGLIGKALSNQSASG